MANIGYARVSSSDQDFDGQIERLKATGCDRVFSEKVSGKSQNGRHALQKALGRFISPLHTRFIGLAGYDQDGWGAYQGA